MRVAAVLVLVLALAAAAAAASGPAVTQRSKYYAVSGATAAQLRVSLDRLGPRGHDAYTAWDVRWRYLFDTGGGGCRLTSIRVSVDVTFTLPRWTPPRSASATLVAKWRRYLVALKRHENGHRDIGVRAGTRTLSALRALAGAGSCSALERRADALGRSFVREANVADLAYDRRTSHGRTQGAAFP